MLELREERVQIMPGVYMPMDGGGLVVASTLALEGDAVVLSRSEITVNGERIGSEQLPGEGIPMPRDSLTFTVLPDEVVAVFPLRYGHFGGEADIGAGAWNSLYRASRSNLYGRAVAVYLLLARRGRLGGEPDG